MKNFNINSKNENAPKWQRFLTMLVLAVLLIAGTSFNGTAQPFNVTGTNKCDGQSATIGLDGSELDKLYHLLRTVDDINYTRITLQNGQGSNITYASQTVIGKYVVYEYTPFPLPQVFDPAIIAAQGTPQVGSVEIFANPVPTIAGATDVCANSVQTYTTESGKSNYTWNVTGGTGTSITNSIAVTWNNVVGQGSVQVSYAENNCTGTSAPLNVNINGVAQIVGGNIYCSIQDAINAAANNDVINVFAGTYNENIVINKPITLNGANANSACNSRGTESKIAPASGIPVSITSDGVTINGFEITTASSVSRAIVTSGVSDLVVSYNNIHDVGSAVSGENVYGLIYSLGSATANNVTVSNNCFVNIGNSNNYQKSNGAIGFLDSGSSGVLTTLKIENNSISNVFAKVDDWSAGGRIAYGIILNIGSSGYMSSTGNVKSASIKNNTISNLTGFIATGIALEGNTENAIVDGNTVANLTGYKLANRAGGGYDINGLKFETNRYVGTVTVQNNSFQANTFMFGTTANLGYAVANYVPMVNGGIAQLGCNWYGTADYGVLGAEYTAYTGKIFNKDGAGTDFVNYSTDATTINCSGVNATPANLNVSYNAASENVVVTFDVANNSSAIYPIPGLNPLVPADMALIVAKYNTLKSASSPAEIKAAALEIGDDIITEYYYMDGVNKVYLKTTGGSDLVKNKYWDKYLNNTSTSLRYPDFSIPTFIVPVGNYSTSTNPLTGGTVTNGWLAPVYGKDLYVTVTFLHNGEVTTATQSVAIPGAPVVNITKGLGFLTIQGAISSTSTTAGDIIEVSPGTYNETVTINKSIHLRGKAGETDNTFIMPPASLPVAADPLSSIVIVSGAGVSAEISGLTIKGPGPSGCGSIGRGIFVRDGATANIHDNKILDIRDNAAPLSGCQNGIAIQVGRNAWSTSGSATIANNIITGYQKGAILVDNTGSSATITGNTITGIGTTAITAQNGIQISRGATAAISNNTSIR
jgi:hypothetical protein